MVKNDETNFNFKGNLIKYFIKQTIIIMIVTFIFFIASYKYFSTYFSIYIVWLMTLNGLLFLYMDLKNIIKINKLQEKVENLEFSIESLRRRIGK